MNFSTCTNLSHRQCSTNCHGKYRIKYITHFSSKIHQRIIPNGMLNYQATNLSGIHTCTHAPHRKQTCTTNKQLYQTSSIHGIPPLFLNSPSSTGNVPNYSSPSSPVVSSTVHRPPQWCHPWFNPPPQWCHLWFNPSSPVVTFTIHTPAQSYHQ